MKEVIFRSVKLKISKFFFSLMKFNIIPKIYNYNALKDKKINLITQKKFTIGLLKRFSVYLIKYMIVLKFKL